jgi:aerobic-type carbon monoxide dehydrogenase small subunit (CoxS/CutS family)
MSDAPVELRVNGIARPVVLEDADTLVEVLRGQLGLTGTKLSCQLQVCGVCTVHVDGRAVSACTMLARDAVGSEVTTIEGVALENGQLHPLQQAFVDHSGLQCGFCTPGFIMTMLGKVHAFRNGETSVEDLHGLDDNICRCTGYAAIREAWDSYLRDHVLGDGHDG